MLLSLLKENWKGIVCSVFLFWVFCYIISCLWVDFRTFFYIEGILWRLVSFFCGSILDFFGVFSISVLLAIFIFFIGSFGIVFNRNNLILLLVSIEVMFLGINLIFIFSFVFFGQKLGLVYALVVLSLAAAEAAIGFGLLVVAFSLVPSVTFTQFNRLKG